MKIALWDIKGKKLGTPVYDLLGCPMRDRIWCYGRWDGATPELAVERALSFTEQGITALNGDPFDHRGLFIPIEAERLAIKKLEAVREAVGDDVELHAGFQDVCFGDFPWQKDGFLPLPEGPGLGVEVDEDWVKPNPWRDDAAVWRAGTGYIASRQDTNGS